MQLNNFILENDMQPDSSDNKSDIASSLNKEAAEETKKKLKHPGGKGIYLLPNLFTTGALFSGFYAVIASMNGDYINAAVAIFLAMLLDGLDGRVARLTNTQTDFGAEYDSLSDMVSFGIAPALVAFSWSLQGLGKIGWVAAFVYVAGAALRLARFNTQIAHADKRFFIGLPSPAAAALVAGTVWIFTEMQLAGVDVNWLMAIIVPAAGLLMVSNVKYHSFKGLDITGKVPFIALIAVMMVFVIVSLDPASVLLIIFLGYALSGPLFYVYEFLSKRKKQP